MGIGLTAFALLILLGFLFWMILQYNRDYQPTPFAQAIREGMEHERAGDFGGAAGAFSRAIRLEPANKMGYLYRGKAHLLAKQFDAAVGDFTEAIALDKHLAPAYLGRGQARLLKQDWPRARSDLDSAIQLDRRQTNAAAFSSRAVLHLHQGAFDQALADANRAVKLARRRYNGYAARAEIRFVMGDYAAALHDFRRALRHRPRNLFALAGLAISHHALRHADEARWIWSQLVERDPRYQHPDVLREDYGCSAPLVEAACQLITELETRS